MTPTEILKKKGKDNPIISSKLQILILKHRENLQTGEIEESLEAENFRKDKPTYIGEFPSLLSDRYL